MPASLAFDTYVEALETAAIRLSEDTAGLPDTRPVPTCEDWSTRELIAHLGMVHRWAAGTVRGDPHGGSDTDAVEAEGMRVADTGAWLRAGADALADALRSAPEDLDVAFFLNDAPAPRSAWARRQCHETTIHAVDGLSARLGRVPLAAEVGIDADVAADGIDELLRGFATRDTKKLHLDSGTHHVLVRPTDVARSWTMHLGQGAMTCDEGSTASEPDTTLSGSAAQLYLGLWHRGDEIDQDGAGILGFWRDRMHVRWN